ncbi:MAG: diaminopimelate epimerase [Planctomycetes bacterium]|nr:diaminopimelate epimerase [Planctomycetota bacterium]
MRFTKMHGIGNCYLYVNCFAEQVKDAAALARAMSDRNTGVGSDGLILIQPSTTADCRMEMYNMDGSRGQMCGNAIRCVAKYVYDRGLSHSNPMRIETDAGLRSLDLTIVEGKVTHARVDMGQPRLRPEDLPVVLSAEQMTDYPIEVLGRPARMTCVSMGNPHAVIHGVGLADLTPRRLEEEGRRIECHPIFPERTNVHFVEVRSPREIAMLPWERGSGATAACGSGACAAVVAGALTGRNDRAVTVHLPGGRLAIEWRPSDDHVYMTGPAAEIFTGDWPD